MKLVNLLIERDLIERRPGRDMRSHALYVTREGEARLARMIAAVRGAEDALADGLCPDERQALIDLLQKLRRTTPGSPGDE